MILLNLIRNNVELYINDMQNIFYETINYKPKATIFFNFIVNKQIPRNNNLFFILI
jgi:hypothetical protein